MHQTTSHITPNWAQLEAPAITGSPKRSPKGIITIPTNCGDLIVTLYSFGARLRLGSSVQEYGLLNNTQHESVLSVSEDGDTLCIESAGYRLEFEKMPLSFSFYKTDKLIIRSSTDGHFVRRHRLPPFSKSADSWYVHLDLQSNERIYGLGEKWGKLNKRGQLISSYNEDALGVNSEASYKNTPFCWSTNGWGVFVHTPAPVMHGVGFAPWSQRSYALQVNDNALDLFLFVGETGAEIINHYTTLTGKAPIPPDWSLGVIISKAYYQDADELLATAHEIRKRGMPCDTITLDGRAWQNTDTRFSFDWDPNRYPEPKIILDKLKGLNFKICVWEYPLISIKNPLFKELSDKDWLLKDRATGETYEYEWDMEPFGDVLTPLPNSGLVDFTHPDAYAYWRDRHKELFSIGVDMIKADFGEQVTDDTIAYNGATGHQLHNVYSFLYNKCVYEAAQKYSKHGPFLFSRSSWTGCQRFPSQWGGDPQADWEGLAASIRGGLSWGMSGAPYYATDIGGFYGDQRDPKLYVRWIQAGVFSAHMRLHGIGAREPWSYGSSAEKAATQILNLRYRLLPYIKNVLAEASSTGLPAQRAMALAYPEEPEAWPFEQQFLFGNDLLVAPCIRPDDTVSVYLPEGDWVRFPTRETFTGGHVHKLTLELHEFAVFARKGAEIPLGPKREYIPDGHDISEEITLWIAGVSEGY